MSSEDIICPKPQRIIHALASDIEETIPEYNFSTLGCEVVIKFSQQSSTTAASNLQLYSNQPRDQHIVHKILECTVDFTSAGVKGHGESSGDSEGTAYVKALLKQSLECIASEFEVGEKSVGLF